MGPHLAEEWRWHSALLPSGYGSPDKVVEGVGGVWFTSPEYLPHSVMLGVAPRRGNHG